MVLGYTFSVFNYIFYCLSRFMKEKKSMLALDIISKICTITSLFFFGSIAGSLNMFIAIPLLVVGIFKEKYDYMKKFIINHGIFLIFLTSYIFSCVVFYDGLSSILITITSVLTLLAIWYFPPQLMRINGIIVCFIYLGYQLSIDNYVGLAEIFVIISNIVSYREYKELERS